MTDPTPSERLAALQARRQPATRPAPGPAGPILNTRRAPDGVAGGSGPAGPPPADPRPAPTTGSSGAKTEVSWGRLATAGASVASFAAMVAAMGPLSDEVESTVTATGEADPASEVDAAPGSTPSAPPVVIDVTSSPARVPPPTGSLPTGSLPVGSPANQPPSTLAPDDSEVAEPPSSLPPSTLPPSSLPPSTQPTETAPPETAPPTTDAPPATAAPTTAPPRSDGSG